MIRFITFIISTLISFFAGVIISDNNTLQIKEYVVRNRKIKKNSRFVFLTDLHGRTFGDGNEKLLNKIDKIHPDFIVVGGDLITAKYSLTVEPVIDLLKILCRRYKVYYSMGNHEARLLWSPKQYGLRYRQFIENLEDCGAVILDNSSLFLDECNIRFSGLNLEQRYYNKKHRFELSKNHVDDLIGVLPKDSFNILLAHNPEYFDAYSRTNADLVLSGHMHGGIMRFPFGYGAIDPRFKIIRPFCWGKFDKNNTKAIVSPGLSMHTIPVRVFNPGEITVVTIKKNRKLKSVFAGIYKETSRNKNKIIKNIKKLIIRIKGYIKK